MSESRRPEVAWFGALCDDDYEQLGVPAASLRSSWSHCREITLAAQRHGFDNILLPSGYDLGIDTVAFASAIAPEIDSMRLLVAVRCGEVWVPQLARQMATLNQVLGGRLTINIISSEMAGESLAAEAAPAADVAAVAPAAPELPPLRKSVTYQPDPFSWKPGAVSCLRKVEAPQAGQSVRGASEIFCRTSLAWPQDSH